VIVGGKREFHHRDTEEEETGLQIGERKAESEFPIPNPAKPLDRSLLFGGTPCE
jgi:hypothetical protein